MATTYKNTTTHPIDLDDGTVVEAGGFVKNPKTEGPLAKHLIESGQLTPTPSGPTGSQAAGRRRSSTDSGGQ